MKKLLEFLKNLNFNSETSLDEEIQLEAAMFQLSFMDGDRTLDIDDMFIATYLDDSSFPIEGEHLVKSLDLTADYKLLVGAEGKVLAIVTPHGLASEGEMTEDVKTEEVATEMSEQSKNEIESLKIENKNLASKIAELTSTITKMSKEKSKPIEVKNTEVDKSQKVDNSNTSMREILKNRKK